MNEIIKAMRVKHLCFIMLLVLLCSTAAAQEVVHVDSARTKIDINRFDQPVMPELKTTPDPIVTPHAPAMPSSAPAVNPNATALPKDLVPSPWLGGMLYGTNSFRDVPGLGYGRTASLMMHRRAGNLTVDGSLSASKDFMSGWGYMNSAQMSLQLHYDFNSTFGITAFGGVNQAGFLTSGADNIWGHYYGGFLTVNANDGAYGIDIGMRRYYNPMVGQYTNVPIVSPYLRMWGQKMSFDFGSILLQSVKGLDQWLNPNRMDINGNPRGGGIIMPNIKPDIKMSSPNIPYIK